MSFPVSDIQYRLYIHIMMYIDKICTNIPVGCSSMYCTSTHLVPIASASRIEYVTTPISAPPPDTPTSAVIITEDNEVFTEGALDMPGATVEIVETSPMVTPKPKSAKKKGMPAYREELLLRYVHHSDHLCV